MIPTIKTPSLLRHPIYNEGYNDWLKWRLAFEGGRRFIDRYLKRSSKRETMREYILRKEITYCPAFAKVAIREVRNSIFHRLSDVVRDGGSKTYQDAILGYNGGVDLLGSSMNNYIGKNIIPELLVMGRIGIYVDMPELDGISKADVKDKHPYLYHYPIEDIYSWQRDPYTQEFTSVLLNDCVIDTDACLPSGESRRSRHLWIDPDDGFVWVQFYDKDDEPQGPIRLNIKKIPFIILDLGESLMMDIADYQIGLLNLSSTDLSYAIRSNFPFYVEQFDNRTESAYVKTPLPPNQYFGPTVEQADASMTRLTPPVFPPPLPNDGLEIETGPNSGRRYPVNTEQPAFISPSTEPLKASMDKQKQMRAEIRELVNLAIANLSSDSNEPVQSGTEDRTLESGLAFIGLTLENAERKVAEYWQMYEGGKDTALIHYPESYELISEGERVDTAGKYIEAFPKVPSKTFQRELLKQTVDILLDNKIATPILRKIHAEIDAAKVLSIDPEIIKSDFETGLVSLETASEARGYPAGEVEAASQDHADRIARIAMSQSVGTGAEANSNLNQARGTGDLGDNNNAGKVEKKESLDTTQDDKVTKKQRGENATLS